MTTIELWARWRDFDQTCQLVDVIAGRYRPARVADDNSCGAT